MGKFFNIVFDDSKAQAGLDRILDASHKAVRSAAYAGAQDLYFEARLRCPESAESHYFYGTESKKTGVRYLFHPGNLRNAIYHAFSKDNSTVKGAGYDRATYHIAWNHQKAPYGFMVEFGTSRAPAHPFIRPAYESRKDEALRIAKGVWVDRVGAVVK